jgi:hypothetical protein
MPRAIPLMEESMVLKERVLEGGGVVPPALPPWPVAEPPLGLERGRAVLEELERVGVWLEAG